MSLNLTKAPWPDPTAAPGLLIMIKCGTLTLSEKEYAFARHRVNLFEELVKATNLFAEKQDTLEQYSGQDCRELLWNIRRRLLEEARK